MPTPPPAFRRIICLLYPGAMSLDICGPMQVFASANDIRASHGLPSSYEITLAARTLAPVATSSGMRLVPDLAWPSLTLTRADTLLVPGGDGVDAYLDDPGLVAWLQQAATQTERMGSVCSGALLLGKAGLLNGQVATTHWSRETQLKAMNPAIDVQADRLHTFSADHPAQHRLFTSAGVTAGIDLALALVEADLGRPLALTVARHLVMFMRRPGGQAQFSPLLSPEVTRAPRLEKLLEWIPGHLGEDLSVENLSRQAHLPPRTLARAFRQELGTTPAQYVERVRVETASALLGQGNASIATVARLCGFGHPETLRRVFRKHMGTSPQAFAQVFGVG